MREIEKANPETLYGIFGDAQWTNKDRLPDYNRLDVSLAYDSRRYPGQKKYYIFNFSIYNLYARQNAYSIYFQRNGGVLDAYQLSVFGTIIPSCSITYYF